MNNPNWKDDYKAKCMSADQAAGEILSGDRILMSPANSVPIDILNALCKRKDDLEGVEVYSDLLTYPFEFLKGEYAGHITYYSSYIGPLERMFLDQGNIESFPLHLSQSNRSFDENGSPDVYLGEVTPPDERGYMSFGPCGIVFANRGCQITKRKIIVQVNSKTPYVHGEENIIHVSEVDCIVEADHDLVPMPEIEITDAEKKIGELIAKEIPDGSTIQLGIGGIPNAVAYFLKDKKDLGVHAEIISDAVVELCKSGVITGQKKTLHKGKVVVGGLIFGTQKLYDFVNNNPIISSMPISYVNDLNVIAANDKLMSINSALTVDLTGQIASESIGHRQFSATGGQVDFVRGAIASKGGKSFIALKSTSTKKDGTLMSRIVLDFKPGTIVTTPRADTMYIVTEYGIADMFLKSVPDRVKAMISIAHPSFRDQLEKQAIEAGLLHAYSIPKAKA
ncbi:MAG: acetyl-CoA hydrolase/transferase C-terminal domain-containing protein [Thermodesulfobacteriota bacterium]|nr:acetyl-CoA hydrolase/transferase C-terminal domain-containing protein [Thermodesulfobacteriota bacterium]